MKENIMFKPLTKQMINKMIEVKKQCWQETYTGIYPQDIIINFDYKRHFNRAMHYIQKENSFPYVILFNKKIIGYFTFSNLKNEVLLDNNINGVYLDNLYLLKAYQKLGIGKKVFEYIFNYAKEHNIATFHHQCNYHNSNAINFYKKMGGVIIKEDINNENKEQDQVLFYYNLK